MATEAEVVERPSYLFRADLVAEMLNLIAALPYNTPIPGANGRVAGDLVNALRELEPVADEKKDLVLGVNGEGAMSRQVDHAR